MFNLVRMNVFSVNVFYVSVVVKNLSLPFHCSEHTLLLLTLLCSSSQVLPLAREFFMLILRANLMFFYFEGYSLLPLDAHFEFSCFKFQESSGICKSCFWQVFIIISQNV